MRLSRYRSHRMVASRVPGSTRMRSHREMPINRYTHTLQSIQTDANVNDIFS